ncbi:MAG: AraC family transcriptional regulator [Lentisphaeria bacterium]|nr:AraC family transcriptional regulator [Lentisphaeria bacterium]
MNVKLLYWGRSWGSASKSGRRQFEYHPYCQLEVCESGHFFMQTDHGKFVLQTGDMLLLPPGTGHYVIYPDENNKFYSLKFESSQAPAEPALILNCDFNLWCIKSLNFCHSEDARHAMPITNDNREIVEGVLGLCMKRFVLKSGRQRSNEPEIFKKIRDTVLFSGAAINVECCAERLNMSAPQLNYQFSKALKEYALSPEEFTVKKLIDQAILYQIDRYLEFTDFSLSTIAEQLKFNNVYTFSRYYKRLTGISPRQRRRSGNHPQ